MRAEATVVLAALADGRITPEEQELLERLADACQMDERHATARLDELHQPAG